MRKTKLLAVVAAAALILAGLGGWASSTNPLHETKAAAPIRVSINPFQMMVNANGLPTSHYDDFSVVFN
jgi:hypothetical protein